MSQGGNRLTRTFSDEEHADVKTTIKSLITKVAPFTTVIDESEIVGFNKIGDGDKMLIADCLTEGKDAEEFLPQRFKMETIQTSNKLHDQLFEIEDDLFELYQHVRRNRRLAGSEASGAVSTFYGIIKAFGTGKDKVATAVAMFKRLQGYYMKRIETAKTKKRKVEAEKMDAEAARATEKTVATA